MAKKKTKHENIFGALEEILLLKPDKKAVEEAIRIAQEKEGMSRKDAENYVNLATLAIHEARQKTFAKLEAEISEKKAITDKLTGLYNKRHFIERLDEEMEKANRHEQELSLILLDMDYFKRINDNFGHLIGDFALKILADLIKKTIRNVDIAARYGGEEFAIILPNTGIEGSSMLAERLRQTVKSEFKEKLKKIVNKKFPHVDISEIDEKKIKGTVSMGVSSFKGKNEKAEPLTEIIIDEADKALYFSKKSGRNHVSYAHKGATIPLNEKIFKDRLSKKLNKLLNKLKDTKRKIGIKGRDLERSKRDEDKEAIRLTKKEITALKNEIKILNKKIEDKRDKIKKMGLVA